MRSEKSPHIISYVAGLQVCYRRQSHLVTDSVKQEASDIWFANVRLVCMCLV